MHSPAQKSARQDIIDRARALAPKFAARADAAEEARQIPRESVEEMLAAGLARILMPARFGGYGLDFETWHDVILEISKVDASHGWCASLIIHHAHLIAQYPEECQQAIWAEGPDVAIAASFAPRAQAVRVDGGYRLSGKTSTFASGVNNSSWVMIGAMDMSAPKPEWLLLMVPPGEYTVRDAWFTAGMRGTGSNTLVAEEVFVPDHRIMSVTRAVGGDYGTEHKDEALYRSALVPVLALVLAGPQVGLARGGLELVTESLAKGKGISYTFYEKASEAPSTQIQLAEAAQLIDTAELHLMRAAADIDAWAARGEYMPFLDRARARMDTGYVARRSREALDLLLSIHGAGSFAEASPLQRIWRDQETGSRHAVINPAISTELYGRALLGVEQQVTPLI